jgi:hypothetical protein
MSPYQISRFSNLVRNWQKDLVRTVRKRFIFTRLGELGVSLLFAVVSAQAATPAFVQSTEQFGLGGGAATVNVNDTVKLGFGQPTQSGNAIVAGFVTGDVNIDFTVTDNGSNSYTCVQGADATNNQNAVLCYTFGGAVANIVTFTCTSSTGMYGFFISEWANVTAIDVSHGNSGTGTSITAGSFTPTVTGDLIIQLADDDSVVPGGGTVTTYTVGSQSNITWALLAVDKIQLIGAQWGVYNSVAALNSTFTKSHSGRWASVAIALKAGASGSVPTGMYISTIKHIWLTGSPWDASGRVEQFPCQAGNLVYFAWMSGTPDTLTSIADSNSNTYTQTGATFNGGSTTETHNFYAASATVSPAQTITITGSYTGASALAYCITGAAASPLDATATNNGNQTTGVTTLGPTITFTPAVVGELTFAQVGQAGNTIINVTGTGQRFHSAPWSGEAISVGGFDENNGWASFVSTSLSSQSYSWTEFNNTTAPGPWVSRADGFKPPASAATPGMNKRMKLEQLDGPGI